MAVPTTTSLALAAKVSAIVMAGATMAELTKDSDELTGVELAGTLETGTALDVSLPFSPHPASKTDPAKTKTVTKRMEYFMKHLF